MSGYQHDRPKSDDDKARESIATRESDAEGRSLSNDAAVDQMNELGVDEGGGGYLDELDQENEQNQASISSAGVGRGDGEGEGEGDGEGEAGGERGAGMAAGQGSGSGADGGDPGAESGQEETAAGGAEAGAKDAGGGGGSGGGDEGGGGAGGGAEQRSVAAPDRTADLGTEETPVLDMSGLDEELKSSVEPHTGMSLGEHQAQGQAALDGLFGDIDSAQMADVAAFEAASSQIADEIRSTFAPQVDSAYDGAVGEIEGGYSAALEQVGAAGETQKGAIGTAATEALGRLDEAGRQANEDLTNAVGAANEKVAQHQAEWPEAFGQVGPEKSEAFATAATDAAGTLRGQEETIAAGFANSGGSLIQQAQGEIAEKAARELVKDGATTIESGAQARATAELQALNLGAPVTSFLTGLSTHVTTKQTEGQATIDGAISEARTKIETDATAAEEKVDADVTAANEQLEADRQAAIDTAGESRDQLHADVEAQACDAEARMIETSADVAESYGSVSAMIGLSFDPGEFIDADTVRAFTEEQSALIAEVQADQACRLDEALASGREAASGGLSPAIEDLKALGSASSTEAGTIGTEKSGAIEAIGSAFIGGLAEVATGVETAAASPIAPLEADFDAFITEIQGELQRRLDEANATLDQKAADYTTELASEVAAYPTNIQPQASEKASGLPATLNQVCTDAYSAMAGLGTDENKLMNALRKIGTALQGRATEEMFAAARGGKSLRGMLSDDLSGNDLSAATQYLAGNRAAGAQYELQAQMRWYGDDEAQIEEILRSLDDKERDALQGQEGWDEVRTDLSDSLGGTDLDVTDALLANQEARADAYRLRDDLDKARRNMDADAVHTALTGMSEERRLQIAQEFHAIQNDAVEAGDRQPAVVDQTLANAALIEFSVGEREVYVPDQSGYGGQGSMQTHSLEGANRNLATAIITQGNDSTAADASRFEVERTRRGGPREANMEMALYASEQQQDAMRVPGSEGYDEAMQAQADRQAALEAEWQRLYGSEKDAPANMREGLTEVYEGEDDQVDASSGLNREQEVHLNMLEDGMNSSRVIARQVELSADGAGTDEERIFRSLEGATPEQIREADRLHTDNTGEGLRERLLGEEDVASGTVHYEQGRDSDFFTEMSGDEARKLEEALLGDSDYWEGADAIQHYRNAEIDHRFSVGEEAGLMAQLEAGTVPAWATALPGIGPSLGAFDAIMGADDEEAQWVRDNFSDLETLLSDVGGGDPSKAFDADGNFLGTPDQLAEYERLSGFVSGTAQNHRDRQDAIASAVTTSIAVIGGVAATFFTGGLAAPMIVAALTGVATVGANQAIRGGRYGWEAMAKDLGIAAIDVAAAGGTKYLDSAEWFLKAVPDERVRKVLIAGGEDFLKEGGRTAVEDSTWEEGGGGVGDVFYSGVRGGTSNMLKAGMGNVMGPADRHTGWTRAVLNGGSVSAQEATGTAYQLGMDAVVRDKTVSSEDAFTQIAQSGGIGAFKGTFDGGNFRHTPQDASIADEHLSRVAAEHSAEADRVAARGEEADARNAAPLQELAAQHQAQLSEGGEGLDAATVQTRVDAAEADMRQVYTESVEAMQAKTADVQSALDESMRVRADAGDQDTTTSPDADVDQGRAPVVQGDDGPTVDSDGSAPSDIEMQRIRLLTDDQRTELLTAIGQGEDPSKALSQVADEAMLDRLIELEQDGSVTQDEIDYVLEPNNDGGRAGRLFMLEQQLREGGAGDS